MIKDKGLKDTKVSQTSCMEEGPCLTCSFAVAEVFAMLQKRKLRVNCRKGRPMDGKRTFARGPGDDYEVVTEKHG